MIQGSGFRAQGECSGFGVEGLRFKVESSWLGFRISTPAGVGRRRLTASPLPERTGSRTTPLGTHPYEPPYAPTTFRTVGLTDDHSRVIQEMTFWFAAWQGACKRGEKGYQGGGLQKGIWGLRVHPARLAWQLTGPPEPSTLPKLRLRQAPGGGGRRRLTASSPHGPTESRKTPPGTPHSAVFSRKM